MRKTKDSKFEYLKIFAMLMIICHHLIAKNVFNIDTEVAGVSFNKLFLQFIGNNAFIANNLFFMVSAWFLCVNSTPIRLKDTFRRIFRLEKVMLFYSIGIPIFFHVFDSQFIEWGG